MLILSFFGEASSETQQGIDFNLLCNFGLVAKNRLMQQALRIPINNIVGTTGTLVLGVASHLGGRCPSYLCTGPLNPRSPQ